MSTAWRKARRWAWTGLLMFNALTASALIYRGGSGSSLSFVSVPLALVCASVFATVAWQDHLRAQRVLAGRSPAVGGSQRDTT